jgi:hypothetical protein
MKVLIGVDPHKTSVAVAAVDEPASGLVERASFPQSRAGLRALERGGEGIGPVVLASVASEAREHPHPCRELGRPDEYRRDASNPNISLLLVTRARVANTLVPKPVPCREEPHERSPAIACVIATAR